MAQNKGLACWMLLWRFKMAQNKTRSMLDAIVTFQDGADLEPTNNLFLSRTPCKILS